MMYRIGFTMINIKKRLVFATVFTLLLMLTLQTFSPVSAAETVLARDNGRIDLHLGCVVRELDSNRVLLNGCVSKFYAPVKPIKILNVSVPLRIIGPDVLRIDFVIYNSGREIIANKSHLWVIVDRLEEWVSVDFSDVNVVINESEFYVGLIVVGGNVYVGIDRSAGPGNNSFLIGVSQTEWLNLTVIENWRGGEFMFRVRVLLPYKLSVVAEPVMVPVYVDGRELGVAGPATVNFLPGSKHNVSVRPVYVLPNSTRLVFERWADGVTSTNRTVVMDRDINLVAVFRRQYYVNVTSPFEASLKPGWYDEGSRLSVSVPEVVQLSEGVRARFLGWEGDVSSTTKDVTVTVDRPLRLVARYGEEYYVSVDAGPGRVSGGGWYRAGEHAVIKAETPYQESEKVRYIFQKWAGSVESSSPTLEVTVNKPLRFEAVWKKQFLVSVEPGAGRVEASQGWYDEGSKITVKAITPISVGPGARLVFAGWSGDVSSAETSLSIEVSSPLTVKALWRRQFYVNVTTPMGTAEGSGWYDEGRQATISIDETVKGFLIRDVFKGWRGDLVSSEREARFVVDSPKNIYAVWEKDYTLLIVTVVSIVAVVSAVVTVLVRRGRKAGQPASQTDGQNQPP